MNVLAGCSTVQTDGVITHVIVPVDKYRELTGEFLSASGAPTPDAVRAAVAVWNDPTTTWRNADAVFAEILADGLEVARRARHVSQKDLGAGIDASQSSISRLEKDPGNAPVNVLRRIAEALAKMPAK